MENSLRQYIDLYKEKRVEIDENSADILNQHRESACSMLEKMKLPYVGSENYEVSDLAAMLAPDYGININRVNLNLNPADSFRCGVPKMSTSLFMLINDSFGYTEESYRGLPEGIEICSLRKKACESPELVDKYYNHIADKENPIVALSSLLAQDGLWIRFGKGMKVDKVIQLVNLLGGADRMMAVRRIVIVLEERAEAKLLVCDHSMNQESSLMALQTIEVFASSGSHFELYDLEESSESTSRLSGLWLSQEKDSSVVINGMTIYNGMTRNEYHIRFAGSGSELRLYGMGIADGERVIDNFSKVKHDFGHCITDELFKYSVDGRARCSFTGLIRVAEGAEKSEAYQSNRNLIGSNEGRMFSKPQLEIYNDDVKCSHGSATGRLDEMQLFYMRTRGISEMTSRLLLKQAFMADVIDKVNIPGLKERLTLMVERRFAGEAAGCHDCNYGCPASIRS